MLDWVGLAAEGGRRRCGGWSAVGVGTGLTYSVSVGRGCRDWAGLSVMVTSFLLEICVPFGSSFDD